MSEFQEKNGVLHVEDISLEKIAETYQTPCYVYSKHAIIRNWQAFQHALPAPHRAFYAVKANSNLAILQVLAEQGAGFDVVSGGEIARVLRAGGKAQDIVFSGVAKSDAEIRYALDVGIGQFNVESAAELERISAIAAELKKTARISLRVNPDVDAKTHPYIATGLEDNKFGIPMAEAIGTYQRAAELPALEVVGADCHIGSQLTETQPFLDALERMLRLVDELAEHGIPLRHIDMGGGLGVTYQDEQPPAVADYIAALLARLQDYPHLSLYLEPGRAIVANAGVLLTRVEYLKSNGFKHFIMVDAGMNDLLRPSLYQAHHDIVNVRASDAPVITGDVVGPVCETGDFLGQQRSLAVAAGDLLAVKSAGAYGFAMSSNYNSRPRPPEVLIAGDQSYLIRARETMDDVWRGETLVPKG
ncbi:diaminopimelate decarboxylase [Aliidiomarina haloalkalitolerans]|uniref:Diaminopimelate decarboxylase n=1 Tax=Aliidiomarina haloalkalitolerans TaxID=859059 RepID=A0A432VR93_9GAMM|nr:diaminopimelate decarboxylase [Aliidiomarina haloalkalitolerans]RUO18827.1 diaminopimelate decarboxylase [Aliidiomarina haloalkalitolerans]